MATVDFPSLANLFPVFQQPDWEIYAPEFTTQTLQSGQELFGAGAAADCLYFIMEGKLAVLKKTGFADKTQVVALLGAGSVAGEGSMATGDYTRGATVMAVEASVVAVLSPESLRQIELDNPRLVISLVKRLLRICSLRLQKSSERLALVL